MSDKIKKVDKDKASDYFSQAKSWANDFYTAAILSRNKWRALSLFIQTPIIILLLICFVFLIPAQHIEPLMINHYSDGETVVTPFNQNNAPQNQSEVSSDITRYIRFRESYSPDTYDYAYRLIELMSSPSVSTDYQNKQSVSNKDSPINVLGNKKYDTVKIESVVFLDNEDKNMNDKNQSHANNKPKKTHTNLAQVDFVVTTHDKADNTVTTTPLTALLSWKYRGIPKDPSKRWMDWNGFVVTHYEVSQRNV